MNISEFLAKCREYYPSLPGDELLSEVSYRMELRNGEEDDANAAFRDEVLRELNRTLSDDDRHFIHYLLEQEIIYHRDLPGGVCESIKFGAYLLFRLGHVEDSLRIWRAKSTNFDTSCGIDVQMLVGAGVDETLAWLRQENSKDAQNAVSWIEDCVETGDFKHLESYRRFASEYFGGA